MGGNTTKNERKKVIGRISAVHRDSFMVRCGQDEFPAKVKGTFYKEDREFPAVGDYVSIICHPEGELGDSVIEEIHERTSIFVRPDNSGHAAGYVKTIKPQVLAVNFDYVFIVCSLNQNYNINRIARYISITLQGGGKPVVILTKADLCDEVEQEVAEVKKISDQVECYAISAVTGQGMDQLKRYWKDGITICLLGSSGVGKSTLVNAMCGSEIMKTAAIREEDGRGRHTTTHRQLLVLPGNVTVIDTPGIREIGICDAKEGIEDTFADVTALVATCRFSDCKHKSEPGCAVTQALRDGTLTEKRWELFQALQAENAWSMKLYKPQKSRK